MRPSEFLTALKKKPFYRNQLVHIERLPPRRARYGALKSPVHPVLMRALRATNTHRFFSHQAQAINAIQNGDDVIVATGTASGKTLCYNVPILNAMLTAPETRALYLFPTKALAHDQLRGLNALLAQMPAPPVVGAYDGDTPPAHRAQLRATANILFTNPDMFHYGVLPHHTAWAAFFHHLNYLVLDEAHSYRGVFGSHVSAILRRLKRVAAHYGAHVQVIATTATIANPQAHLQNLTGRQTQLIDDDGAPKAGKVFALWNPPQIKGVQKKRRSSVGEAAAIFSELVRARIRNITFCKSRVVAELILKYGRDALKKTDPALVRRVTAYRAGYLVERRRAIEAGLNSGALIGVTATNALELGVDVGGLVAVISVGYPGSVASLWQQVGRAGRRGQSQKDTSLAILVAQDNPLDQYFMRHPDALFSKPHEHALIDPENLHVLLPHLACAAQELPLTPADEQIFGAGFVSAMIALENDGTLVYQPDADNWIYMGKNQPWRRVNIRSIGRKPVTLIDLSRDGAEIEVMDSTVAASRVHPGAIYIHNGEAYRVKTLDLALGRAMLMPATVDYYTQTIETNHLRVLAVQRKKTLKRAAVFWGDVGITRQVVGYRQIHHLTERMGKQRPLSLPPNHYQTRAIWWMLPPAWRVAVERRGFNFAGGLRAIEHTLAGILPLFAMCDRLDIGGHSVAKTDTGEALIFMYDAHPGGVGITERGFEMAEQLWRATLSTIKECPCENGCPSCIFSPKASDSNRDLDKKAALWIMESLLR